MEPVTAIYTKAFGFSLFPHYRIVYILKACWANMPAGENTIMFS